MCIYTPSGKALEYSELATNPYRGCTHGCTYCYVPMILKMRRPDFHAQSVVRPTFFAQLERSAKKTPPTSPVLLSFTSDPYHTDDTSATRKTLQILRETGHTFTTLTKGGTRALRDIDLFRPGKDFFASTLTSLDPAVSEFYEPKAARPDDRLEALKAFHDADIFTWVSLEPVIDPDWALDIIEKTHEFVDFFKIGVANYMKLPHPVDWRQFALDAIYLCERLGKKYLLKKDLAKYLQS